MLGPRVSVDIGKEESGRKIDGGSKDFEAIGAFVAEGPVLVRGLCVAENHG